jgi:hypothetical protein
MIDTSRTPAWADQDELQAIDCILAQLATRPTHPDCEWLSERLNAARGYLVNNTWDEYRAQLEFILEAPTSGNCDQDLLQRATKVVENLLKAARTH